MNLSLLLDLDDTLLDNDQNAFFAAFATTLAESLSRYAPADLITRGLQRGVGAMFLNTDPARTLSDAFYGAFLAEVPIADTSSLRTNVDTYYREIYPSLVSHTQLRPEAVQLVDWAFAQGYQVVIATNPFFTNGAVQERLRWAGLPPEKYPFALLTSNETFHFAKSPAYYSEVMARLGWPEGPALMVGDDLYTDVIPARALGLPVFHVTARSADSPSMAANGAGKIGDLRPWLENIDPDQLQPNYDSRDAILATLLSTPAGLAGLVAGVPPDLWARCPDSEEWGLNEIMCHLRDVDAEVNLPRLSTFLKESNPFIAGRTTDDWVKERDYNRQDGRRALRELTEERKTLVTALTALSAEDWERTARHSIFGPTDLLEMTGFIAEHDRSHVQQVFKTLAQFAEPQACDADLPVRQGSG